MALWINVFCKLCILWQLKRLHKVDLSISIHRIEWVRTINFERTPEDIFYGIPYCLTVLIINEHRRCLLYSASLLTKYSHTSISSVLIWSRRLAGASIFLQWKYVAKLTVGKSNNTGTPHSRFMHFNHISTQSLIVLLVMVSYSIVICEKPQCTHDIDIVLSNIFLRKAAILGRLTQTVKEVP